MTNNIRRANVLVLTGDGLNCEVETLAAFIQAGATGTIIHINELLEQPKSLSTYNILAIPGGFSFGDEINSGQILALKIKHGLAHEFSEFMTQDNLIIGICNGFQTLSKLGVFTEQEFKQRILTLTHNRDKQFIDKWTEVNINSKSKCVWTKGISQSFNLPIRHAEGRVIFKGTTAEKKNEYYQRLEINGQIVMKYSADVNGSHSQIAGICDTTGRIFGLMPHPEAATNNILNPMLSQKRENSIPLEIFKNAINYIENQN